ncbi:MAG: alpha-2-macroglobulin family protein [Polyangiales bacterium]
MTRRLLPLLPLLLATVARADEHGEAVFIAAPARPFLLLDARRRYLPTEHAHAFVQRRGGGDVSLGVFRVHDPRAFLAASVTRQGVSTAAGPWGEACEALLRSRAPLPRAHPRLTLVADRTVSTAPAPDARRAVGDESAAYDSNEDDEGMVETWGVSARGWGVADVDLGALPAGTYLLRAQDGMFATSALLSVGETVVLLRRGDTRDHVRVTDPDGRGVPGVTVTSDEARAVTDAQGDATLPPSDAPTRTVLVARGDDLAWAEATHTRLAACDPRVYLATGRPVYRPDEPVHVRGHIRGCAPLAGARVRVFPTAAGDAGETVTADADGNFSATLVARAQIGAEHDGRVHARTLSLDTRPVPRTTVRLTLDRPWAAAGESVTVTATPADGIEVDPWTFTLPDGTRHPGERAGAGARLTFVMPPTTSAWTRATVSATAHVAGEVFTARASLWTGRLREVLSLTTPTDRGVEGAEVTAQVTARDLGGGPSPGAVRLAVFGSDGNGPRGEARAVRDLDVDASGAATLPLRLVGAGPWWLRATRGDAVAESILWERPRPATLGANGPLALQPEHPLVAVGDTLRVALRAAGPTWVSLEQSGVWEGQYVVPQDGRASVALRVPEGARGLATLVATRVHRGQVETSTAVAEVATSQRFTLTAESDRRSHPAGATARVQVRARTPAGEGKSAVLSMWLEDAGWWALGEDRHPSVDDYFRATGRPASAGDSTRPLGFGSEEGRRSDSGMFWNGERLPGTTYRHAWGHGGAVINLRVRGDLGVVANALARAAGRAGAVMCPARVRPAGIVDLEVRELPWDLAAGALATRTETFVRRDGDGLRFACDAPLGGLSGSGSGSGHGGGGAGLRGAAPQIRDREQLVGTRWFLAARRIPANGTLTVEVPMPDAPGRWRLHALAIGDDGAGATVDTDLDTVQPVAVSLGLGRAMRVGDVIEGEARVHRTVPTETPLRLDLLAEGGAAVEAPPASDLAFDAPGDARVRFRVRATRVGEAAVRATVNRDGRALDALRAALQVRDDLAEQPVDYRAVITAQPTDVDLPIPSLGAPATVTVQVDGSMRDAVEETLTSLREPRWWLAALALDRYASLRALESVVARMPGAERLRETLRSDLTGAAAELHRLRGSDGELAWWSQIPGDLGLTATALALGAADAHDWGDAWERLRVASDTARGGLAARIAAAFARGNREPARVSALLARVGDADLASLTWAVRAARSRGDDAQLRALAPRLRDALDRAVVGAPTTPCAGPAWFLCFAREGQRGAVAFAARILLDAQPAARPSVLRAAHWLSTQPEELRRWSWGTAEGDVLALLQALGASSGPVPVVARMGDAVLARGDARRGLVVPLREGGTLRLSVEGAPGRFARVRAVGTLRLAPPAQGLGPAQLTQRVEGAGETREMVLAFTLPRDATSVELHAPLPAGLELAHGAEAPVAQRDPWRGWRELDGPVGNTRARVTRLDDGVRVRFARLTAGAHTVRVPLLTVARGEFSAGSAWLRAAEREVWAVTPAWRVTVP